MYVRKHTCKKGEPNLTCAMFADWVEQRYQVHICTETARCWLGKLGFSRVHCQKGVYFDGRDRDDVVADRNNFLDCMVELDRKSLTCDGIVPLLQEGEL